jgi:hypothetical protein
MAALYLKRLILKYTHFLNLNLINMQDGRYKEPVSDLAEQAFKHLEFVEEERKRGSHVFDQSWSGSDQGTVS